MVAITAPTPANNYSIDTTEVTQGQYHLWLNTNPKLPDATDPTCGYVTSYAEQTTGGALYTGADASRHPIAGVDWCDAYSYCKAVGKRLCGGIGGGAVDFSTGYADASQSQWFRVCSTGATTTYPYGGTYMAKFCNGFDYWNGDTSTMKTVPVSTLSNCVTAGSGFASVYDLSGNVWEWEHSCGSGSCLIRGGSFNGTQPMKCDYVLNSVRSAVSSDIGFRCCSP
jgi:formylglycine-generating enzyme required for sulfatase activity